MSNRASNNKRLKQKTTAALPKREAPLPVKKGFEIVNGRSLNPFSGCAGVSVAVAA
jgi:hypothetical protein